MLVVPLKGDPITTVDGQEHIVSGFNGIKKDKTTGRLFPSVYLEGVKDGPIGFDEIREIKRVHVDYDKATGLLEAMAPVKRSLHLPQPNDKITIRSPFNKNEEMEIVVGNIKLSDSGGSFSLRLGFSEKDDNTTWYDLSTILDIDNGMAFDKKRFEKLYVEYFPSSWRS